MLRIVAIITLGLVITCGGVVTYVYLNFRNLAAAALRGPIMERIETADLPADQKARITEEVERISQSFREGRLSYGQLAQVFERLERGSFLVLVDIESLKARGLKAGDWTAADRDEIVRIFQRLQRAVVEGRISRERARELLSSIEVPGKRNRRELKATLSKDEVKTLMAKVLRETNLAGVPDKPYILEFSDRLRLEIAEAIATRPSAVPPTTPTTSTTPAE